MSDGILGFGPFWGPFLAKIRKSHLTPTSPTWRPHREVVQGAANAQIFKTLPIFHPETGRSTFNNFVLEWQLAEAGPFKKSEVLGKKSTLIFPIT